MLQYIATIVLALFLLGTGYNVRVVLANEDSFRVLNTELSFVLDKDQIDTKRLIVYGLHNGTTIRILVSDLIDKITGEHIESGNIVFGNNNNVLNQSVYLNEGQIKEIPLNIRITKAGSFSGNIVLVGTNDTTFAIPITVTTKPVYMEAIPFVLIGIFVSIALWSILSYSSLKTRFDSLKLNLNEMNEVVFYYEGHIKIYDFYLKNMMTYLNKFIENMKKSQIDDASDNFNRANDILLEMKSPNNLDLTKVQGDANFEGISTDDYLTLIYKQEPSLETSPARKSGEIQPAGPLANYMRTLGSLKFKLTSYLTSEKIKHHIMLSIIVILVGIIASVSLTLQQDYLKSLRLIGWWDILILVGIGLGIDNIKQILSKFISK